MIDRDCMEKILVIGASGLLGNAMMREYSQNYEVHGTYKSHNVDRKNMHQLDVLQKAAVGSLLERLKPDLVIDTHGITSVDYCETNKEEATMINVEGTRNIADSVKLAGCRLVYISTDGVFDGEKKTPYVEEDKPNPVNHYGVTKLMAERIVAQQERHVIARTSTLFGRGGTRKTPTFVGWVISQLSENQEIQVVTDQHHNPTYVDYLAQVIGKLFEKNANGVFHTAGGTTISRFDLALKIADTFELDSNLIKPITTSELKQKARRPLRLGLDISKAERATSIKGMSIDEELRQFKNAPSNA